MDRFEDAKLRIKEATDLVALIEGYLPLRPRGRLLLALCPFHPEKSPSFTVYPDSQHYHCYGCGKSGDVFTFLQEREGLGFREAMEALAERAGVPLEGVFSRGARDGAREGTRGPDVHRVLGEVAGFFHAALLGPKGGAARDYFERRGLTEAMEPWLLGYHPPRAGALGAFVRERGLPRAVIEEAGLLRGEREPFAGRVIFPIHDERGRLVAFGGRVLPGEGAPAEPGGHAPPKYVNSPESPFFAKRRVLYGLPHCKRAGARRILVVEGYTDAIACHLAGFPGAVATLGTAFTGEHARKLERYATEGVVLLFDGDRAGQQAAERAMRELVDTRLEVRIAMLSGAKDPAEVVLGAPGEDPDLVTERRARFADLVEGADRALPTWFRLLRRRLDFGVAADLEAAARECAELLGLVGSPLARRALLGEMARHLAVRPEDLARMVRPARRPGAPEAAGRNGGEAAPTGAAPKGLPAGLPAAPPAAPPVAERADRELLACLLADPALVRQVDGESFALPAVGELVALVRDAVAAGRAERAGVVRHLFTCCTEREDLRAVLAPAAQRADSIREPADFFAVLQQGRHRVRGRTEVRILRQQLQEALTAGDRHTADELTRRIVEQLRADRRRPTAP